MKLILVLVVLFLLIGQASALQVVPGLYGFGTDTRAAYGAANDPIIFIVTDLTSDNGVPGDSFRNGIAVKNGSFREAINYNPPANTGVVILFEVSGTITYEGYLTVDGSYVTIAGASAPSPGILLKGSTLQVHGHDVLVQHIRVRPGDHAGYVTPDNRDGLNVNVGALTPNNVVIDHCSVSWSIDENMGIGGSGVYNVTVSNTMICEGLSNSLHTKGEHSMGLICAGGDDISIINNLFAHNMNRNPYVTWVTGVSADILIANNMMYNIGEINANYADRTTVDHFNLVGNVVIGGGDSGFYASDRFPTLLRDQNDASEMYIADNKCEDGAGTYTQTSANDWSRVREVTGGTVETTCKVLNPAFAYPSGYTPMASTAVESYVLDNVGARPADQDSVDSRIISEVIGGSGSIIDSPSDVGGYPTLAENNITLSIPSNPHTDSGNGYTNLEVWLQGLADVVEGGAGPGPRANITYWENNDTSDNTLDITIDVNQNVLFNVTANQTITTWTWKKDTVDQSHNYDNITLNWTALGEKSVTVTAGNANGTSSAIEWTVTVENIGTWNLDKNLTINHSMVHEDLTNFSVLINLTDSDLADHAQADGDDIIFKTSDGVTQLDHEQEFWNKTTGEYFGWVRVPALNSTVNTTIRMYYNNSLAGNSENPTGVWDDNYKAVYHMSETPPGTVYDSTSNNNDATTSDMDAADQVTGQINGALDFDEVNDYLYTGVDASLDCGNNVTITSYHKRDDALIPASALQALVVYRAGVSSSQYSLYWDEDERLSSWMYDGTWQSFTGTTQVQNTDPHRVDFVWNGTYAWTYIDGAQDNAGAFAYTPNNGAEVLWIGADSYSANREFDGIGDETRISNTPRSAGWISTGWNNTEYPDLFFSIGAEHSKGVPNITSWENNKTSDASFDIALNVSEVINFNVTANQSIDTWNWYDGGIDQSNNYDNWTHSWTGPGLKTVIANGTNVNGTSGSIQWNVTISNPNWYDPLWIKMKTLTINQTMVNQTIGNVHYILLVDMVDGDLTKAQADGDDIIFTDSTNTTQLPHQLSSFNSTTGAIVAYVGLTDPSNVSNVNMYYNNSGATNTEDKAGTWGANASGIWLMDEGTGSYINDSSGNNNNGTIHGADWVDDGLNFVSANDDYVDYGNDSSVHIASDITIAIDINATSWVSEANMMSYSNGGETSAENTFYGFAVINDPCDILIGHEYGEGVNQYEVFNTNLAVVTDYRLYAVRDSTAKTWTLYIDGDQFGSAYTFTNNPTGGSNNLLLMGKTPYAVDPVYFNGTITNARMFNIVRSASYISTIYNNTEYPALFLSLGPELPGGDSTPPTYSNANHSTTEAGESCTFSIQYDDDTALESTGQYIFSTNNTGPWVNESSVNWSTTPQWANESKTLNTTNGVTVGYRWYAEDDVGNINNTPIYTLTVQDTTPPGSITGPTSSTGNFWHNWTWTNPGDADYNYTSIYINGILTVNSSLEYYNLSASAHNTSNISTHTVDTIGNVNPAWVNDSSNVPNNVVTITNTSDWSGNESETVYVDYDSTDADGDTPTYSCNRTDLFSDFNTSTGIGNWTTNDLSAGNYTVDFGVSDGYGSEDNYTMNITVTDLSNVIFEYWDGDSWQENPEDYHLWFECFWNTSEYPDGVAPNAEQSGSQHSLRITNNGTGPGTPKMKFNESSPAEVAVYIDDDYTVAGAVVLTDSYKAVSTSLNPGENVTLSAWVKLEDLTSIWEYEVHVTTE